MARWGQEILAEKKNKVLNANVGHFGMCTPRQPYIHVPHKLFNSSDNPHMLDNVVNVLTTRFRSAARIRAITSEYRAGIPIEQ